jgi:hypothetical protein
MATLKDSIAQVEQLTNTSFMPTYSALSQEGPDLGGREFQLLSKPKIAIVTGSSVSSTGFAPLWHTMDVELGYPHTLLNLEYLANRDLRKYNVIVLPSSGSYLKVIGKSGVQNLKNWVQNGGTLIAIGSGSAFLADSLSGFSKVSLLRQSLNKLDSYERALNYEKKAGKTKLDSIAFWNGKIEPLIPKKGEKTDIHILKEQDTYRRRFMPRGAILRVNLDEEHWLNYGAGSRVPALMYTSYAFLSKSPVEAAGRFSDEQNIRLSGLLWPEARNRWANTAYVTRESAGKGQIILFAGDPHYRSYFFGTRRIFLNAVFLGPGFGSRQASLYY